MISTDLYWFAWHRGDMHLMCLSEPHGMYDGVRQASWNCCTWINGGSQQANPRKYFLFWPHEYELSPHGHEIGAHELSRTSNCRKFKISAKGAIPKQIHIESRHGIQSLPILVHQLVSPPDPRSRASSYSFCTSSTRLAPFMLERFKSPIVFETSNLTS